MEIEWQDAPEGIYYSHERWYDSQEILYVYNTIAQDKRKYFGYFITKKEFILIRIGRLSFQSETIYPYHTTEELSDLLDESISI